MDPAMDIDFNDVKSSEIAYKMLEQLNSKQV
jgi:hypothetical protein